jgi:hypothetical protein
VVEMFKVKAFVQGDVQGEFFTLNTFKPCNINGLRVSVQGVQGDLIFLYIYNI